MAILFCVFCPVASRVPAAQLGELITRLCVLTILCPLVTVLIARWTGLISNTRMHLPRDRHIPLATAFVYYFASYWLLLQRFPPSLVHSILLGSCAAIAIDFFINYFYKVSIHTTAAAILPAVTGVMVLRHLPVPGWVLPAAIAIAAIVGLARWWMGAHTLGQLLLGYAVGIGSQLAFSAFY